MVTVHPPKYNGLPVVEAARKVWLTKSGALVEDGDADASMLFARKGQRMPVTSLARFDNASNFFPGLATAQEPQGAGNSHSPASKPAKAPRRRKGGLF